MTEFDAADLERFRAQQREKYEARAAALEAEIASLPERQAADAAERERRISEIEARSAAIDAELATTEAEYQQQITAAEQRVESARSKFTESEIVGSITSAARAAGAFNADQILTIVKPHTRVLENGETVVLDLFANSMFSPAEAVERLKAEPEKHGNLFNK